MTSSPSHLVVDRAACAGHGMCYATAATLIEPDDLGNPVVRFDPIPEAELDAARTAVSACPERALSLSTAPPVTDSEELPR